MSDANCATPGSSSGPERLTAYPFEVITTTLQAKAVHTLIEYSTITGEEFQLLKPNYLYSFAVNFTVDTPNFSENGLNVFFSKSDNADMSDPTLLILQPCAYSNDTTMDCCFNGNFVSEPNQYYAVQITGNTTSGSAYIISATRLSAMVEITPVP
jgi:hypothetical protein